jgi:hypothetical protein
VLLSNSELFVTNSFLLLAAFHTAAMGVGTSTLNQLRDSFLKDGGGGWHGHVLATFSAVGNVIAFAMFWLAWSVSDDAGVTDDNKKIMLSIAAIYTTCFALAILELTAAPSLASKAYLSFAVHATSLFAFLMTFALYSYLSTAWDTSSHGECFAHKHGACDKLQWSWYTAMVFTTIGVSARFAWSTAINPKFSSDQLAANSQVKETYEMTTVGSRVRPVVTSKNVVTSSKAPHLGRRRAVQG